MPATYDALKNKQAELIRKSLDGSVFLAELTATAIEAITQDSVATPGTPELVALPTGWDDLGFLSDDGAQFSRDVSSSEVSSWGSITPTRTDITADTTTLQVSCQETKLLTIGLATGADLSAVTPDATTGEVGFSKPSRPNAKHYRVLSLAVDQTDNGELYIARFLPRAKVSSFAEQSFGKSDDPIMWGVTMTGEIDDTLGYSERWMFGGPGWQAITTAMGFA